jgi:hypothetical protein
MAESRRNTCIVDKQHDMQGCVVDDVDHQAWYVDSQS